MTQLTVGPSGDFVLRPGNETDTGLAGEAGLTLSTTASRPGSPVYFTRDPYAVLDFWPVADGGARTRLLDLRTEYEASFAEGPLGGSFSIPGGRDLYPFQKAGVEYALSRRHALIGDQPGLGKTAQAVVIANEMRAKRVLVIAPANVRRQWRREYLAWSTHHQPRPYLIEKGADGVSPHATMLVTSYDLARTDGIHAALCALDYDLIVLDEAHYLKTTDAQRTRSVFGGGESGFADSFLARKAEKVVALTGTPLPNRPRECYTLSRALCWDAIDWLSEEGFKHRYNPSFRWPSGKVEERVGRLPELQARLRCNFMVRRLKRDVLKQLPDKHYELAYVEPNTPVKQVLRQEAAHGFHSMPLEKIFSLLDGEMSFGGGAVSTMRREMGEAMAPLAAEHVAFVLDGGVEKVLVACHHHSVMAVLEEKLRPYGCVAVSGGVSPAQKEMRKQAFIGQPDIRVYLTQLDMVVGLDGLQGVCNHAVFAEASWVPGQNEQFIDRLHRIGQKDSVLAQFLVAPGSLSERVLANMIEKAHDIHGALDRRRA